MRARWSKFALFVLGLSYRRTIAAIVVNREQRGSGNVLISVAAARGHSEMSTTAETAEEDVATARRDSFTNIPWLRRYNDVHHTTSRERDVTANPPNWDAGSVEFLNYPRIRRKRAHYIEAHRFRVTGLSW